MEDVGSWRIVQDQGFAQITAQPAEILHVTSLVEHARLPEEAGPEDSTLVQKVRHWVSILAKRREKEMRGLLCA